MKNLDYTDQIESGLRLDLNLRLLKQLGYATMIETDHLS